MASVFAQIVEGKLPCHKIYENDSFLAFLDINPIKLGHTLVIPKQEIDYIFDLDDTLYKEIDYLKSAYKKYSYLIIGYNNCIPSIICL